MTKKIAARLSLKEWLDKKGQSTTDFAAEIGEAVSTISRVHNGGSFSLAVARKIWLATKRKVNLLET